MKTHLTHEELLHQLAQFLLDATVAYENEALRDDELPSAADMARQFKLDTELVKKKLRILKHAQLIQPLSYSPKRYRFNRYELKHLNEDNELYSIFGGGNAPYPLHY